MKNSESEMDRNKHVGRRHTGRGWSRALVAATVALGMIVGSAVVAPAAEAASRWREGWCKKDEGLSVVADFSNIEPSRWPSEARPDGWIIRCFMGNSISRFVGDGRTQSLEAVGLEYTVSGSLMDSIHGVKGTATAGDQGRFWFYTTANLGAGATTWGGSPYAVSGNVTNWVQGVSFSAGVNPVPRPQYGPDALEADPPVIEGTPQVGHRLSAASPGWNANLDSLSYQWYRDGQKISGATSAEYTLTIEDAGRSITVQVTGSKTTYDDLTLESDPLKVPEGVLQASSPTIGGTATIGSTLTAKVAGWGPLPLRFAYQWLRDGSPIAGAHGSTYKVVAADLNRKLSVQVVGSRTGYTSATRVSATVTAGLAQFRAPRPTISGAAKKGRTLTAKAGTWSPRPATLTYQWYRSGKAIKGATRSTYKLTASDRKNEITVKVTGSSSNYRTLTVTSSAVKVEFGRFKAARPGITGTARVGKTLKAKTGTWTPKPSTYTYQWYRSGKAIAGATRSSYKLTRSDKGKTITVKVTGSKKGYNTKASSSSSRTGKVK